LKSSAKRFSDALKMPYKATVDHLETGVKDEKIGAAVEIAEWMNETLKTIRRKSKDQEVRSLLKDMVVITGDVYKLKNGINVIKTEQLGRFFTIEAVFNAKDVKTQAELVANVQSVQKELGIVKQLLMALAEAMGHPLEIQERE
jgi:hypothetical protein